MGALSYSYRAVVGGILRNPTGAAGFAVFGLGFALVAANAVFSQPQFHPAPIWSGAGTTGAINTAQKSEGDRNRSSITRSVLTQRISLKNIPVPTAKPSFRKNVAKPELVREMQSGLAAIGLYSGKVDGIYGSGTKKAIVDFQTSAGLLPDGMASYDLLNRVKATAAASSKRDDKPGTTLASVILDDASNTDFDRDTVMRIQSGLKEKFG